MRTMSREQAEFSKQFALLPVKQMSDLIVSESKTLSSVDKDCLAFCIATAIGKYLNFIGVTMTEENTYETACMMIEAHPHLPIEAVKTFFYECKRGTYGYHYNKMDGSKILMWFDKFVEEYDKQIDDMEYAKHLNTKGDLASPIALETEENEPVDMDELYASFHGKTKEQLLRERKEKEIRFDVLKENRHLYDSMPVEEADKLIEQAIINRLQQEGLITF